MLQYVSRSILFCAALRFYRIKTSHLQSESLDESLLQFFRDTFVQDMAGETKNDRNDRGLLLLGFEGLIYNCYFGMILEYWLLVITTQL